MSDNDFYEVFMSGEILPLNRECEGEDEEKRTICTPIDKLSNWLVGLRKKTISLNDLIRNLGELFDFPDCKWICNIDKSNEEHVFNVMEKNLQQLITNLEKNELDPVQIIEQSSALEGIFLNRNVKEWINRRQRLVSININDINFNECLIKTHLEEDEFHDYDDEDFFKEAIHLAGFGMAQGIKISNQNQKHQLSQPDILLHKNYFHHKITTSSHDNSKPDFCEKPNLIQNQVDRKKELDHIQVLVQQCKQDDTQWKDISQKLQEKVTETYSHQVLEKAKKEQKRRAYFSKITSIICPVAFWQPLINDMRLNCDAIVMLLDIEDKLSSNSIDEAKNLSLNFFSKFGSHLYVGDIYFGGIFHVKSFYDSDAEIDIALVKNLVNSAHATAVEGYRSKLGIHGVLEGYRKELKAGIITEDEKVKVHEIISCVGGPHDVEVMQMWDFGLNNNNNSWVVVNSGKPFIDNGILHSKDYIGVWSLIKNNTTFKNGKTLGQFLLDTWQVYTGFKTGEDWLQTTQRLGKRDNFRMFLNRLMKSLKENYTVEKLLSIFKDLHAYIEDIYAHHGDSTLWNSELCENVNVQQLFENISFFNLSQYDREQITRSVKGLLKLACLEDFPYYTHITQWLHDRGNSLDGEYCNRIEDWMSMLHHRYMPLCRQKVTNTPLSNRHGHTGADIMKRFVSEMPQNVKNILDALLKRNDTSGYVFVMSILIRFDYDPIENVFRTEPTIENFESFLSDAETDIQLYRTNQMNCSLIQQAYAIQFLIHVILTKDPKSHKVETASAWFSDIALHLKNIDIQIERDIKSLIFKINVELQSILAALNDIVEKTNNPKISWNFFENLSDDLSSSRCQKLYNHCNDYSHDFAAESETKEMLNVLGLSEYFPGRISLRDALSIRDSQYSKPTGLSDVPLIILRKIISMNYHFREHVLSDFFKTVGSNASDDDTNDLLSNSPPCDDTRDAEAVFSTKMLHPLDVFSAIFQCCDPFLKRTIVHKMSVCQLAVPFIYPRLGSNENVISLWPLREIRIDENAESVIEQPIRAISFLRIGNGPVGSKSKLINEFLRDLNEEHSTFFHKDCPLGMHKRKLSNGMVEVSWYVPTKNTNILTTNLESVQGNFSQDKEPIDHIQYPLTVFNLRGDAFSFKAQTEVILDTSSIIIVLITFEDLQEQKYHDILRKIHSSRASVIIMTNITDFNRARPILQEYCKVKEVEQSKINLLSLFDRLQQRQLNVSEIKNKLVKTISILFKESLAIVLEKKLDKLPFNIITDEGDMCKEGRRCAEIISAQIDKYQDVSTRKSYILPLQCESFWHTWSKQHKERKRTWNKATYDIDETLQQSMICLRKKQVETLNEAPTVVALFVKMLLQLSDCDEKLNFFLIWLRQSMDCKSRQILPDLLNRFSLAFETYENSRTKENLAIVDSAELKLAHASFGIEHLLREMGQIYEAFIYCKDYAKCDITTKTMQILLLLPALVAKLLLLGQPLELMDGDAANVPLKWTKAVFSGLENLIGQKRCLVISVLGIQSSGKSTLLNTMFGLQYPVRAGRCTSGIYAQIVPVDHSRSTLNFDYVLILDTEGLRAPELAGKNVHHDNELATLVIGLADIVIINIKGETITDMEDVLQIVIHGLLRLKQANKKLNLRQYSVFVHQNVSASDAKRQTLQGNKKIIKNLDAMTKEAALQERVRDIVSFTDVVKFNPTQDVKYIADLWHGSPPMAPVSPSYSESVSDVAKWILHNVARNVHTLAIPDFCMHFNMIWKGILADDFVFSFRNCLEVKAYGMLESESQKLIWELEELKLEWINKNINPKLNSCDSPEDLDLCIVNLEVEFIREIKKKLSEAKKRLTYFLENSELSDYMIHWKEKKILNLEMKTDSLHTDVKVKIKQEQDKYKVLFKNKDILLSKQQIVNQKAKDLAESFKSGKLTRQEIEKKFEEMWGDLLDKLAPVTSQKKNQKMVEHLKADIEEALHNNFSKHSHLIETGLKMHGIGRDPSIKQLKDSITAKDILVEHIGVTLGTRKISKLFRLTNFRKATLNILNDIFNKIDCYFESLLKQNVEYDKTHISKLLEIIRTRFSHHNDTSSDQEFSLTPNLEIFVALHVSRYALVMFEIIIKAYEEEHGLRSRLQNHKPLARQLFISTCEAKTQEIIAKNMFCTEIKTFIEKKLHQMLPLQIQREIRQQFNFRKHHLIKAVMTDLATAEIFEDFMEYIKYPENFVQIWITKFTNKVIYTKQKSRDSLYMNWINDNLDMLIDDIIAAVRKVTHENCSYTIYDWIEHFRKQEIAQHLTITKTSFLHVTDYCVNDFHGFMTNIIKQLRDDVRKEIIIECTSHDPNQMVLPAETPYHEIFESLWGCKEKCPWCAEPCQKAEKDHGSEDDPHMCIQHRPNGLAGIFNTEHKKFKVESCNFCVQSTARLLCGDWCKCPTQNCNQHHEYKTYKTYMKDWDIAPDADMSNSTFWNWFMAKFSTQVANYFGLNSPDIPISWKRINKSVAIDSLSEVYG